MYFSLFNCIIVLFPWDFGYDRHKKQRERDKTC